MEELSIGYIHSGKLNNIQEKFLEILKRKFIDIVFVDIFQQISEKELLELSACDVIYNDSGEDNAIYLLKILEEIGKKTLESVKAVLQENKWRTYEICKKNNIPVPESILLSKDFEIAKQQLIDFNKWPVILKGVRGTWGEYVERANDINEAMDVIKKFFDKRQKKIFILAQEFINSFSYRVTYIDKEIVQTVIKENNNWKCTGVYARNFKTFEIDEELKRIIEDVIKNFDIKICGVDFLKKDDNWLVIEVNSEPALDFFDAEISMLHEKIVNLLVKTALEVRERQSLPILTLKNHNNFKPSLPI